MGENDIVVSIGAKTTDLNRALKDAAERSAAAAEEIERRFNTAGLSGAIAMGILKGAVAAFSFDRIAQGLVEANKEIASFGDTARRVGLDLVKFQELRFAAQKQGMTGASTYKGLESVAEQLNKLRFGETELSKFLDDNNVKYKDRKGEVIGTNEALSLAANLIQNAATESDKIDIAKAFGLTKDWVPLLEKGADELRRMGDEAQKSGEIIDAETVQRAKDFEVAWEKGWAGFAIEAKSALTGLLPLMETIIGKSREIVGRFVDNHRIDGVIKDFEKNGVDGASKSSLDFVSRQEKLGNSQISQENYDKVNARLQALDNEAKAKSAASAAKKPDQINTNKTDVSSFHQSRGSSGGGGGGSGGRSEEEVRYDQIQRYLDSLEKAGRVLEAEKASIGLSNAERAKAIELARIGTVTDEDQRAKLDQLVTKNLELRASIDQAREAQQGLNDASKFFGDSAVSALENLVLGGGKAKDVVESLAKSLASAALKASLLGEGPLAGIFGTKGKDGAAGGLLGTLFSGATKSFFGGAGKFSAGAGGYLGEGPFLAAADGGYISGPGSSRSDSIPARLSNGEFVMNAEATRRNRALLEALNTGAGFADGGLVGRFSAPVIMPRIPQAIPASGGGSGGTYAPVYHIDARGADAGAVARIERSLAERDRQFAANVGAVQRASQLRGTRG